MKEEIKKMFRRIELDKSNDSCGFEFADGFSCTFDNIATCYDDRLKLYDLVKDLQSQLKAKEEENKRYRELGFKYLNDQNNKLKEVIKEAREYIKKHIQKYDIDGAIGNFDEFEILASPKTLLEILSKGENK